MSAMKYAKVDDRLYAVSYSTDGRPLSIDVMAGFWRNVWARPTDLSQKMQRVVARAKLDLDGSPATGKR